jgi:PHP family Zn ribbon phosphoesterase
MDAVEISIHANKADYLAKNKYLQGKTFIQSSDSHLPDQIGTTYCYLQMETVSFDEIRKALHQQEKRQVFMREEVE